MQTHKHDDFELETIIHTLYVVAGYDFRDYQHASIKRRIKLYASSNGMKHISELIPKILYENGFADLLLINIYVTVTEMFSNPWVFKFINDQVLPALKIFPRVNIWHAGCATGEEVYSMAILLREHGILDNCQIYATDFNDNSLEIARKGIYPLKDLQKHTQNYIKSGGKNSFSDYYHVKYESVQLDKSLQEKIVFTNHNLTEDSSFAEIHLIICRNVLIYFKPELQNRALQLFNDSLSHRGYLVLGDKETLRQSGIENNFETIAPKEKIYRKK